MKKTIDFLKSINIDNNDYIVVGCSGGPDSMCLLDILYKNNYKIICTHINHNIRKESTNEYKFLKNYCNERKILFEGLELDSKKIHNESYYRKKRYNFYKNIATKYKTKYIMTAHHGDDLIETILMRITRGSNLKGYLGFNKIYQEQEYLIIKPLIFYNKDEILKYNKINNIPYMNDYTNEENNYTRNRYRHNILPFLKTENIDIHSKYLKFSEELEETNNYISKIVLKEKNTNYKNNVLELDKFLKLDEFIMFKELENILSSIYMDDIDVINKQHITKIIKELEKNKNFTLNLPKGIIVKRNYQKLIIDKEKIIDAYNYQFDSILELPNNYKLEIIDESNDTSNYIIRIDSNEVKLPLHVRTRNDGDKIEIKNLNGHKKVKSIFIDEKINDDLRATWPIVVDDNNNIIWIPGLRKSKFDRKKEENYDIIIKYTRKEQTNEKK